MSPKAKGSFFVPYFDTVRLSVGFTDEISISPDVHACAWPGREVVNRDRRAPSVGTVQSSTAHAGEGEAFHVGLLLLVQSSRSSQGSPPFVPAEIKVKFTAYKTPNECQFAV